MLGQHASTWLVISLCTPTETERCVSAPMRCCRTLLPDFYRQRRIELMIEVRSFQREAAVAKRRNLDANEQGMSIVSRSSTP